MIFTRQLLNKNIKYYDIVDDSATIKAHTYEELSSLVDAYKNLLLANGAKHGQSIVIGTQPSLDQIASILACSELGLVICIVGTPLDMDNLEFYSKSINNRKVSISYKMLLPIDFFIIQDEKFTNKYETFRDTINTTILMSEQTLDYTPNDKIYATEDSIFLRCFDSNKHLLIEHTHQFITQLSMRNSLFYYGSVGMVRNLNHGSSIATYFLPSLLSERVTEFYNIYYKEQNLYNRFFSEAKIILDHLMFPYTEIMDEFFDNDISLGNCILYTLGIIRKQWVNKLQNKVKDVITFFGNSEVSGPFLINQATDIDFEENKFKMVDDFYKLKINNSSELEILIPNASKYANTQDKFIIINDRYIFQGRSNLFRINDEIVDVQRWNKMINEYLQSYLVVDTPKNRIYLAIWENHVDKELFNKINEDLKKYSKGKHYVYKYACLDYTQFCNNNALNTAALIEYFRNIGE